MVATFRSDVVVWTYPFAIWTDPFAIWTDPFAIWTDPFAIWTFPVAIWADPFATCPHYVLCTCGYLSLHAPLPAMLMEEGRGGGINSCKHKCTVHKLPKV